jgi:RHS repeat-associated protein
MLHRLLLVLTLWPAVTRSSPCELYPIALPASLFSNAVPGAVVSDILQGVQPGNFGWLSWAGSPGEPALVTSLSPPGNSFTYVNPDNLADHQLAVGDWVRGKPGVSNSKPVRDALESLKQIEVMLPVWDFTRGTGEHTDYHVSGFARVRLLNYQLPNQNRITAQFVGDVQCDAQNLSPIVDAGPDLSITLPAVALLNGSVTDDGLPIGGLLTQFWNLVAGPGTVTFAQAGAAVTTATLDLPGTYVLRLTASDSELSDSDEVTVVVNRENHPPFAFGQSIVSDEDTVVPIFLQSMDPDDDTVTNIVLSLPSFGSLSGSPPDLFYQPNPDYNGPDSFSFKASDGALDSDVATVEISIRPVNDAPMADAQSVGLSEDAETLITLSGSDVEGDALNYHLLSLPTNGVLLPTPTNFIYRANPNFHGSDGFTFKANDGRLDSLPAQVSITVTSINDAPIVFAGADQFINLPANTANLEGAVDDDEFVPGQPVTTLWTVLSGPGVVTFADRSARVTTATFASPGIYLLRLQADDGFITESDHVMITINEPPRVNAGSGLTNTIPATFALSGTVSDDGIPTNGAVTVQWRKVSGPGTVFFSDPNATDTTAAFSQSGLYVLSLTANDSAASTGDEIMVLANRAPLVDAGADQTNDILHITLHGTVADDGLPENVAASPFWMKLRGPGEVTFDNPASPETAAFFSEPGLYELRLSADDSLAVVSDDLTVLINTGPVVDAGPDQTIPLTSTVTLNSIVADDGVPAGAPLILSWEVVSGPGTVTLPQPDLATTTAQFSAVGEYIFRLTANDSLLTSSDEVTITVVKPNEAPMVLAGQDQIVILPASANLNGTVSDDGSPENATLTTAWNQVSGPGAVAFANRFALGTSASFPQAGNYVLRLTASDSELTSSSDVRIAVRTPAMNEPPVVNAGPDKTVGLTNAATLCGAVTDDGLPKGAALAVTWTKVNGPGAATFENPNLAATRATFSELGTYVLRLTANDSVSSVSDDVTVTVYPFNQPPIVDAGADQTVFVPDPALLLPVSAAPTSGNVALSVSLSSVAHWNNSIGQPGLNAPVLWYGLAASGTNLYAAGSFTQAGGAAINFVARWNGQTWLPLYDLRPSNPTNPASPPIGSAGIGSGQNVVARGDEAFFRGAFADLDRDGHTEPAARWTGTGWESWHPLITNTIVSGSGCLAISSNAVYYGGDRGFTTNNAVDGAPIASYGIAKWTGVRWEALGRGVENGLVRALAVATNGDVYAAGTFSFVAVNGVANNIARFNGTNWYALGNGLTGCTRFACHTEIYALAVSETSEVYAGGDFTTAGSLSSKFLAMWDGADWRTLGLGVDGAVHSISTFGRDVFVGGAFTKAGGFNARHLARWNGEFWTPLGLGSTNGVSLTPYAFAPTPSGVFVGGDFLEAGGLSASRLALWEFPVQPARSVLLTGRATDDGLPSDATLSFSWSQITGPGIVSFSDATNATTHVSFSAVGTYVLRLTVSDSDLNGFDDVAVIVRGNQPPTVSAGSDQTIGLTESVNLTGGVSDDGIPEGDAPPAIWSVVNGPTGGNVTFANLTETNTTALFSAQGAYVLRLTANDSQFSASDDVIITVNKANQPPAVSISSVSTVNVMNGLVLSGTVSDDGLPIGITNVFWTQISGPDAVRFTNANSAVTLARFTTAGTYVLRLTATDSELTSAQNRTITVTGSNLPPVIGGPRNQPPVVAAGPDRTVLTQRPVLLAGTATDDGLPLGSALHLDWSAVSGPDRVYFSDSRQPDATGSFNTPGSYVLRLSANDGELTAYDDVTFTVVAPTNEPPLVFAGLDVEIVRPNTAELVGVAMDDGLPVGYPLVSTWSKVSGPGAVAFVPASITNGQPLARATFDAPGNYVLRLTASDSALSGFDDLTVSVQEGTNQPPVVNAGTNLSVALPGVALLQTTASDDGLPNGRLEVTWSKVSGPGNASFSTLDGAYRVSFSTPGEYVLRLTANDTELIGSDEVSVTVYNEPNAPTVAILSPADSAFVTAPNIVTGSVSSGILQSWTLQYRLKRSGSGTVEFPLPGGEGEPWSLLATGTNQVSASLLGTFDPTLLLNGIYELQLTAIDLVGRSSTSSPITIIADRGMKIGHFTLSFTDLTIPVAGIPIQIVRTYDSRPARAGITGDFGAGWTFDLKNVRLQKNRHLGGSWDQSSTGGLFPSYGIVTASPRVVTITFPDGRVQKFQMTLAPFCQSLSPLIYPDVSFEPLANTHGTLTPLFESAGQIVEDTQLVWFGDVPGRADFVSYERLLNPPPGAADNVLFDPDLFEFTSLEGFRYVISETNGLRRVTDPNGNRLTLTTNGVTWTNAQGGAGLTVRFERDGLGRITNIVDAVGHAMIYRYDARGDLVDVTDRDGHTNGFTYDGQHSLIGIYDARGVQILQNRYDDEGRLLQNTDASGNSISYFQDLPNRRELVTNRLGFVTANEYDNHGNVIRVSDASGVVAAYTYDANGNLLSKSSVNGCACPALYTYDANDRVSSETDHRGNTTRYTYTSTGKVLTMTEPSGFATTNTYDTRGNLLSTRDAAGQVTTFIWNNLGRPTSMSDGRGITRFAYNELGFLTNEVDALGHSTEYTVDANGNPLSQAVTWSRVSATQLARLNSRARGWREASTAPTPVTLSLETNVVRLVMRHEYTPSGLPLRTLYYDGSSTETRYNSNGGKSSVTDPLGRTTSYGYNEQGLIASVAHPDGCTETFEYDAEGRLISGVDRRGFQTRFEYDPRGKLVRTTFADGSEIRASYYADGSLYSETAKNGEVTSYTIDGDGNRVAVSNSVGITRYTYNYKRFVTSKVDPLGRTNQYEYDALGRNTRIVYPDGTSKAATFSGKLLTSETDPSGRTTTYTYDALGRVTAATDAAGAMTRFAYDELGNRISETDPLGRSTSFEYDSMRRRTRVVYADATSETTAYDVAGRVTARTDRDNNATQFAYDASDNVIAITNALGGTTRYSYDCGGNVLDRTDPDGALTRFEYDSLGRMTRLLLPCGSSETTAYDPAGRVASRTYPNGRTTMFSYDLRNNLNSAVDALNRAVSFTYDAAGNRLTETDANGQTTSHEYDAVDRRIRTIHRDGTSERFLYDGSGRLTAHVDPRGKTSTFEHDAAGRLITATDPLGRVTRYTYDATGSRTSETNPNRLTTRYEYDELSRRTRTTYPDNSSVLVAYDRLGRPASEADAQGHTTFFAYDELSRLTARQDPLGNTTRFGYDPVGRLTSQTDAENHTTRFEYDCLGKRNRITFPNGATQQFTYDAAGRRVGEIDPNGNSTHFGYDAAGHLIGITNALGHVTQFGYDSLDLLIMQTDALGHVTAFEYDALGRRTRTVYPDGAKVGVAYDNNSRPIRETDAAGNSTFTAFDDTGRVIAVTNALGEVTSFAYDAAGRLISRTDPLGRTTTFEYDALARRTRTVYADGTARSTTYDTVGRLTSETDQAGITTHFGYDAMGHLTAVTNALGEIVSYGYDSVGRLSAWTNANGAVTTFVYDALGRRIRRTLPGGQTETYGYDAAGNLVTRTNFNGRVIQHSYDALNRLTAKIPDVQSQAAGSAPVMFAYDAIGQRTNMVDASGSTEYRYDVRQRLIEKIKSWAGLAIASTLLYGYDTNGNLTSIRSSLPNGTDVSYACDALNRLTVVSDSRLGAANYRYDPASNLQSFTEPNGIESAFAHDALDRLTNLGISRASVPLANYQYTLGPAGHRLGAAETLTLNSQPSVGYHAYGYDAAYRLTHETIQAGAGDAPASLAYTYDPAGNRLTRASQLASLGSQLFTYDLNDRLIGDHYDVDGNTTNAFIVSALTAEITEVLDRFDAEDRLLERTTTNDSGVSTIHLLYDGDGNRVGKTVTAAGNTSNTLFVVDDRNLTGYAQVLEELTSANDEGFAVTRVYTWGHALLSEDQFVDGHWIASFPGRDGHGNIRFLTDASAAVTDTFDYDAFGNRVAQSVLNPATGQREPFSSLTAHLATPHNYLFAGEQFDADLNLYYLRARYAEPERGRFWTPDSFEGFANDLPSLHRYTFNRNDPVNRIDPSGRLSLGETLAVSTLAPLVRGIVLELFNGANNYSYGLAGGNALKFSSREEAYFIDSLAAGPGWKFGKPNFWATARGAAFLLSYNPNIWQGKKACWYECIPFDLDAPVYGPAAAFPMFELEPGELFQELSDWKHGSLLGATLHRIAEGYRHAGDVAYADGLPAEAQWIPNFANYMASSVAGVLEASVSPQSYVDGWRHVNDRAYRTILREFESGAGGPWAFAQGLSSAAGDLFGYNSVLEGSFGVDRSSLSQLGTAERWTRGFAGLSQIAGTIAGGLRLYNPSIGGARLGAAVLADAPSTALVAPETKLCLNPRLRDPGLRSHVLAALEESKLSRQASRFEEFEARTQTATQLEFGFIDELGAAATSATQLEFGFTQAVERQSFARDFYRAATGWSDTKITSHLRGIDFNQAVSVVNLPAGTILVQYQLPGGRIGNYFAPPGTQANQLGIYTSGLVGNSYVLPRSVRALQSTAATVVDDWSMSGFGWRIQTQGGGQQFFIPNGASAMTP